MKQKANKLPKRFKERWVKALRSGKYKQTAGRLYNKEEDGYCCLGVACAISRVSKNNLRGYIPRNIKKKLPESFPKILLETDDMGTTVRKLIRMNDNGKSFKYISYYIDRYL